MELGDVHLEDARVLCAHVLFKDLGDAFGHDQVALAVALEVERVGRVDLSVLVFEGNQAIAEAAMQGLRGVWLDCCKASITSTLTPGTCWGVAALQVPKTANFIY